MSETQTIAAQTAAARGVCHSLHRAYRDWRLYPPGHPTADAGIVELGDAVAGYLGAWGPLFLAVQEDALLAEGQSVYEAEASRDNLAFVMFRDGIRSLSIHPGCSAEELEGLVDCLAHADDLADMEHDFVTALWERDLGHIGYQVVDPLLGGGTLGEGMVDALRETVTNRLESVYSQAAPQNGPAETKMRRVRARRYEEDSLRLTPEELARAKRAGEELSMGLEDYADVLLEIAGKIPIVAQSDVVIQSIASVVGAFLDGGNLRRAASLLDHVERLEAQRWAPDGSVGFIAGEAITADRLRLLLRLARQESSPDSEMIEQLLRSVRQWITASLLQILTETEDRSMRKTVLDILGEEEAVPWRDLEPLLWDPRWYVVRNAVHLAARMGHEDLAEFSPRLLVHADARVRRETVRALGRLNGLGTVRGLVQALSDQDPSVRTLAANAVARKGGPQQAALLLARIEDRTFSSLSPEEMEAFLGAYAQLAQERAVPLLERTWKRSLLSSKPLALRTAAVLALGRIRGTVAAAALQAAAKADDPQIRRAALEARQRTGARNAGDES